MHLVRQPSIRLLALVSAVTIPLVGGIGAAHAGMTITVSTTSDVLADDGLCSLREAVAAANTDTASGVSAGECPAGAGTDTVLVPPGTYSLTGCELTPATDMTIAGTGPRAAILDGRASCRVLSVAAGAVTISALTIRNGNAPAGAGISNAGTVTIQSSTLSGNTASGDGGGIRNSGTLTIENSTIAGNAAGGQGAALLNSGNASLSFSTVSGNGVFTHTGASTTLSGTVLANTAGGDCGGVSITSGGHNLVESPGPCFAAGGSDIVGFDPKLGPLGNDGGVTQTLRPFTGSPVLDAAGATCPQRDQRGNRRPQGQACDIGSVELSCSIVGTEGSDLIEPTGGGVDIICGLGGNDRLKGGVGNDVLIGGPGTDALHSAEGDDLLAGGPGNDQLRPGAGDNKLDGGPGSDTIEYGNITAGVTVDLVAGTTAGGSVNDALKNMENVDGTPFADALLGTPGANGLDGKGGNDTIGAFGGDDTLVGDVGDDTLDAGDGADALLPGSGSNTARGDAGTDLVSYSGLAAGVSVDLGAGTTAGAASDSLDGIEKATGTGFGDTLTGDGGNNTLNGLGGEDTLNGAGLGDTLNGGDGNDTLNGGDGNDPLRPGAGTNGISGGPGIDTVDYSGLTGGGVNVDLGAGTTTGAVSDTLSGVENAIGTPQADSLFGSGFANVLTGLQGADSLDSVDGISGNDSVNGGADADTCSVDPGDRASECP